MATSFTYSVSGDTQNGIVSAAALDGQIRASVITIALEGVLVVGDDLTIVFKADLPPADETALDAVVAAHDGEPISVDPPVNKDGAPIVALDAPTDPRDKKPVFVMSPATDGYLTWIIGTGDNPNATPPDTGRGTGDAYRLDFTAQEMIDAGGSEVVKTSEYEFIEPVEIHDGQVVWSPVENWGADDRFSLGSRVPANVAVPNGSNTGNCNLVATLAGYNVIIPAAGDGTHDVDLSAAAPVPAGGFGYWDNDYDTGTVTPSATPGGADWHLLDVNVYSWLIRNVLLNHPLGVFDIDVYKTEYFHPSWRLFWEVRKKTSGQGTITGWIFCFRKQVQ